MSDESKNLDRIHDLELQVEGLRKGAGKVPVTLLLSSVVTVAVILSGLLFMIDSRVSPVKLSVGTEQAQREESNRRTERSARDHEDKGHPNANAALAQLSGVNEEVNAFGKSLAGMEQRLSQLERNSLSAGEIDAQISQVQTSAERANTGVADIRETLNSLEVLPRSEINIRFARAEDNRKANAILVEQTLLDLRRELGLDRGRGISRRTFGINE